MDIPVVDGARLLVLDPPPHERTWAAARAFAGMAAELELERRLSEDGVKHWMTNVSPAENPLSETLGGAHGAGEAALVATGLTAQTE